MTFEETRKNLQNLHSELCAALRRGEMAWYGMASDYQSKYAFSADYDTTFKHNYYKHATACQETAARLEKLALPVEPDEVHGFIAALQEAADRCPWPPDVRDRAERLQEKIGTIANKEAHCGDH